MQLKGVQAGMRSTKVWQRMLALLAVFALAAAACGDGDGGTTDGDGDEDGAVDLSGQTVEVAAVWSGPEQERFEMVLQAFADETGAQTQFTSTGDDIASVLGPRVSGGDPPNVAVLPQPALLEQFANDDALAPLEDAVGDEVDENYAEVWRELATINDTLYGVWFKASGKSMIWYNIHAFDNAGVSPPEDWEGLQSTAQTVSDSGVTPWSIGGADGWTLSDWFENIYLRVAGPDGYDQLTNHEIPWTDETVITSLEHFADIVGEPNMVAGGVQGALQTDFVTSVTQVYANPQSPDAAMVYEGDFVAGEITGNTEAQLGQDADFFAFPAIEGSPPSVVGSGDVVVAFTDDEATMALVEFLATPEAAEIWAAEGGFISPNQAVDTSVYPDDISRRAAETVTEAETFRFDLSDLQPPEFGSTSGQGIWGALQDFVRNPDPQATAQALEQQASQTFGE